MKKDSDLLIQVHDYLNECRTRQMQAHVAELARRLGTSRQQLHTTFSRCAGISPGKYLQNLQMEWARGLLRSGRRVAEVAELLGPSPSAFQRAYKSRFGYAPGRDSAARG